LQRALGIGPTIARNCCRCACKSRWGRNRCRRSGVN